MELRSKVSTFNAILSVRHSLISATILTLLLGVQQSCTPSKSQLFTTTIPAMGTRVELTLEVPNTVIARKWVKLVSDELARISFELYEGEPNGALGRLNRERQTESTELIGLIQRAFEITDLTNGAFDIRIGELVRQYGFVSSVPGSNNLDSLNELTQAAQSLRFEKYGQSYRLAGSDATLTLGGIAKGYAVDRCVRILQEAGCRAGIVNAGGDLFVWGRPKHNPWLIGVEDPETDELLAILELSTGGCATSGSYRNRYVVHGEIVHHLIQPDSGLPAGGKLSVTVTAPTCELADALATGMFVMPLDSALALANSLEGIGLLVMTDQPAVFQDDEMAGIISAPG